MSAQVVFGTWRAASSRPYRRGTSAPIVPTMRNVVPRLIHRLWRSPFPEGEGLAWFHSTPQVVFETWRAADCRPYRCDTIHLHRFYSQRSRNGTQAVPYGFADRSIFSTVVVQKRPLFDPCSQMAPRSNMQNCQLSIVNCQFQKAPRSRNNRRRGFATLLYFSFRFFSTTVAPRPMAAAARMAMAASSLAWSPVRGLPVLETARLQWA